MSLRICHLFSCLALLVLPSSITAAELEVERFSFGETGSRVEIHLRLTGEIVDGDTERLAALFNTLLPNYRLSAGTAITISLDSDGGDFAEGVALMRYFHEHAFSTVIEDGKRCLSACAIAFLGGHFINEASLGETRRVLHPGGSLGFHAPSLDLGGDNLVPATLLQNSYGQALAALASLMQEAEEFDIPLTLLRQIIETPPNSMYYVNTVDDVARWNIQVPVPGRDRFPTATELARLCAHYDIWAAGNSAIALNDRGEGHLTRLINEWAPAFEYVEGSVGIRAIYAHVQTLEYDYNEYCIVETLVFNGANGSAPSVSHGVTRTNGSPQATIEGMQQANILNNPAPPLFRYPAETLISGLPRVPYP